MRYRLALPEGVVFELDQDRQSLTNDILTVSRETLPANDGTACTGPEEELASTPYIQASNQMIRDRAAAIAGDTDRPMEMVRRLTGWVYDNLEKRPVLGIPDARTTLETRIGDCNEHAALFAALARSLGIPTRVAAGVTFHQGAFYYHAWNEACIGDRWISLDTTKNQLPADLTHLKFFNGETRELVRIGALIGRLGIEILPEGREDEGRRTR
jgi:transglutaminase-like putative cysteine protease